MFSSLDTLKGEITHFIPEIKREEKCFINEVCNEFECAMITLFRHLFDLDNQMVIYILSQCTVYKKRILKYENFTIKCGTLQYTGMSDTLVVNHRTKGIS